MPSSRLYLCEKPSQARDIARILGARRKGDGCLMGETDGQIIAVTWCYGHLLEMMPPDGYDPAFKRWTLENLPIVPQQWRLTARPDGQAQLKVIQHLLQETSEVIIATDADREGELIAREVLTLSRWRGPVWRLWLSALDDVSIRKALATLLPGAKTEPLWQAGLGRARADWLVGMNLTRAYTITGRRTGYDGVLSVGRVQTPTLKLIVDRDRTIEAFVPVAYFDVTAWFVLAGDADFPATEQTKKASLPDNSPPRRFHARWVPPEAVADAEGRCLQRDSAASVVAKVTGHLGYITKAETRRIKEPPPLPFDLSTLQQIASRRWGMGAQQVLDTAQSLYETHKAITYPRTDCPYLPVSQHHEASTLLAAIVASDPELTTLVRGANPTLCSRAWDDSKITAHHAIIPTAAKVDVRRMNSAETRVYDLIRRRYLAQFYPAYEYDRSDVEVEIEQALFRTTGRIMRIVGWHIVLGGETPSESTDDEPPLPALTLGEAAAALDVILEDKQTRPPPRYTEGTLIAAMKNVGRNVADPRLKKVLKDTSGIGTEATRAGMIELLLKRGFVVREGRRNLVSTAAGRALVDVLPDVVKDPATTALWEQGLDEIARGAATLAPFLERQVRWIGEIVTLVKTGRLPSSLATLVGTSSSVGVDEQVNNVVAITTDAASTTQPDPAVKPKVTRSRKSKATTPVAAPAAPAPAPAPAAASNAPPDGSQCPRCKNGRLIQRTARRGPHTGSTFLGCSTFPHCRYMVGSSD